MPESLVDLTRHVSKATSIQWILGPSRRYLEKEMKSKQKVKIEPVSKRSPVSRVEHFTRDTRHGESSYWVLKCGQVFVVAMAIMAASSGCDHEKTPTSTNTAADSDSKITGAGQGGKKKQTAKEAGQGGRDQNELWMISTRNLKELVDGKPVFEVTRFDNEKWQLKEISSIFPETPSDVTTIIYVHGYGFDSEKAESVAQDFFRAIINRAPESQRIRFLVWSWPSTMRAHRYLADLKEKAKRMDHEAFYLAWFLDQFEKNAEVHVIGSAMGCRALAGAFHLHSGAKFGGQKWPDNADRCSIRGVFVSAATHAEWMHGDGRHNQAIAGVERLLMVNNSEDLKLVQYGTRLYPNKAAIGLDGFQQLDELGDLAKRVRQIDAAEVLGERHGIENYLASDELMEHVWKFIFTE